MPPCHRHSAIIGSPLDRRQFLAQGTAAAIGSMLLAACGDVTSPSPPQSVDVSVTLASYPALASVGGIARLNGTSTPIAVVRATADSYRAFSLICPHRSGPVGVVGSGFRCPNHGATFNASGAWTGGQSTRGLFEFTVVSDGTTLTITS